jgi:DNA-binding MarR family transcriptional regulator/GNAT superfamily N-acetyltransferase
MNPLSIQQVRRFNRTVAERIGALDDRFLGRARPIGESRLLWEIGPDGADVRAVRARLGLDSGYMSRMLSSLDKQGLIALHTHPLDRRVRRVVLTEAGLRERAELDQRSDALAARILAPLDTQQRDALLAAMAEVERLLQPSFVCFDIEDPSSDDARWCFEQYFAELNQRFDAGFDPARSLSADAHELAAPAGALIVARLHGRPVGCVALKYHRDAPAELKRMWVSHASRGLGIGRRLLDLAELRAIESGARVIRLETNRVLTEAIALYRRCGYAEVAPFSDEPYAHHWLEKTLREARPG